jgi:photosystem II stability/assembly factor-like uncharacterized protein
MKKLSYLLLILALASPWLVRATTPARALDMSDIGAFGTVAPGQGWLRFGESLFWTSNDGLSWQDVTPPLAGDETIQAVHFADPTLGWALLASGPSYTLALSTDGGASWQRQSLDLPGLGDSLSPPSAAFMGWRDASHGWLVFKLATGSSFSLGLLFVTDDGGLSWAARTIPLGEPVTFASDALAWTAGGPAGDSLFRTLDGGLTWEAQQPAGTNVHYLLPRFDDESNGILPVLAAEGAAVRADFYATADGGQSWTMVGSFPLPADTPLDTDPPLAMLGGASLVQSMPNSNGIIRADGGQFEMIANDDGQSAALTQLSMSTLDTGWGLAEIGSCEGQPEGGMTCSRESQLLLTTDGGLHWVPIPLPLSGQTSVAETFALSNKLADPESVSPQDADTQPYTGQGFDKCGLPSVSNMQTWWNSSPYNGFNLYIGGSLYACRATSLPTSSYVSSVSAQGWRFFPTWVGPQAPCMSDRYHSVFSYNTTTAYNQGVAEADAALAVAVNLGLAAPDWSGTVIYYDLETYGTTDSCRNAAKAFISGWTHELRAHNNLAGAYGSACYNVTDWSTIANVPDAVWLAHWYLNPAYLPTASTADSCVSSSLWPNHQRLRQYAGDHTELWGGVSLGGIDSNALDGPLTVRNGLGSTPPSTPIAANPVAGGTIARGSDTWLTWKTTGDSCYLHVWGNGVDLSTNGICSIYHLGSRLPGNYWWQVIAYNPFGSTAGAAWQFGVAPALPGTLSASPVGSSGANLAWILSSDDPTYVDGYRVYADGALVGTVARGVNTFQVQNLGCGSVHNFYVTSSWQGVASGPGNTASFSGATCPPPLLTPQNGSTSLSLRPTFTWGAVSGASGYSLQVSDVADFSVLRVNASVSGTSYTPSSDLLPNTLHYWRARTTSAAGTSDWSTARTFTTGNPPGTPGVISPPSNGITYDYTPLLDWTDSPLPVGASLDHYQFQLNTSTNFSAPLYDQATSGSDFTVPVDFPPNTKYYWRVRAFDSLGQYSSWGGPWSVRAAMLPPTPVGPADGALLLGLRPTSDWTDVLGASSYLIQLSPQSDFSTVLRSSTVTGSSYRPTSDLPADTTLYWRVQAQGSNGPSLWSSTWSFTTGNPPSIPSLQSPASGALITDYQTTLEWTDSTLPAGTTLDHYQIRLATDNGFTDLVYNDSTAISQFPLPAPLAPNARYYWQVRALNTAGHFSSWSTTRYFNTAIEPPVLKTPVDGVQLPYLWINFDWEDVVGASGYQIRISQHADFSTILRSAQRTSSTYFVNTGLPADTVLYWQVQATGANGPSLWSPVWSLRTANPPSIPLLLFPASGVLLTSYQPALDWTDSTVPPGTTLDYYQVQLATSSSFTSPLYSATTTLSVFPLPTPLDPNCVYYWRVRTFSTAGQYSVWSSVWSFRTVLLPPALLAPANGRMTANRRPTFDWADITGATSYTIQVSRYSNFSINLFSAQVSGSSSYRHPRYLPTGVTLYWRVRANGPNGPSDWAEVPARTFRIVLP